MNQKTIVKKQLKILLRGRLGYINQSVPFSSINILQNKKTNFSQVFGGKLKGKLSSFIYP